MALKIEDLRSVCTGQSLERGRTYYQEGRVHILEKSGHSITAQVEGSSLYTVGVDLRNGLFAICTCPYSHEGYCKHIVAVLIAVIEGARKEEAEAVRQEAAGIAATLIDRVDPGELKRFLKREILRNPQLRTHFLQYFRQKTA